MRAKLAVTVSVAAVLAALVGCAVLWRWANLTYAGGHLVRGYWLGVVGSALPGLASGAGWLWLRRERGSREPGAVEWGMARFFWFAVAFLVFMMVFPLL
jgi:hypothetical protein